MFFKRVFFKEKFNIFIHDHDIIKSILIDEASFLQGFKKDFSGDLSKSMTFLLFIVKKLPLTHRSTKYSKKTTF
jgi:hypothetical protein